MDERDYRAMNLRPSAKNFSNHPNRWGATEMKDEKYLDIPVFPYLKVKGNKILTKVRVLGEDRRYYLKLAWVESAIGVTHELYVELISYCYAMILSQPFNTDLKDVITGYDLYELDESNLTEKERMCELFNKRS